MGGMRRILALLVGLVLPGMVGPVDPVRLPAGGVAGWPAWRSWGSRARQEAAGGGSRRARSALSQRGAGSTGRSASVTTPDRTRAKS